MPKKINLLVNTHTPETDQLVTIELGAGDQGKPVWVKAFKGARYQLADSDTQIAPEKIRLKRVGRNLHLILEDQKEADFIVQNYYDSDMLEGKPKGVFGYSQDGKLYEYLAEEGSATLETIQLADGGTPVAKALSGPALSEDFELSGLFLAPAAVGMGAGATTGAAAAAAAAVAGATGSETARVAAVGVSVVALGSTTAGPVVAKEKSYQAVLPLGPSADINEATSTRTNKDDASDLMAVSVSVWAETAVKLNITSATTQASNRLGMMISADGSLQSVDRATDVTQVSRVNALVATALGLGGVDMVRGAPEATIKAEASVNFDSSNAYGNVLAAIAGTVEINGSIDASISKLASGFSSQDALNATLNAALVQGALVAEDEMGTQTGLSAAVQSLINADISKVLMPSKSTIQVKEYISLRRSLVRRWHWMKSKVGPNTSWPVNGMTASSPPKQQHRQAQVLGHDSRKADSSGKNHHGSEVFMNS